MSLQNLGSLDEAMRREDVPFHGAGQADALCKHAPHPRAQSSLRVSQKQSYLRRVSRKVHGRCEEIRGRSLIPGSGLIVEAILVWSLILTSSDGTFQQEQLGRRTV